MYLEMLSTTFQMAHHLDRPGFGIHMKKFFSLKLISLVNFPVNGITFSKRKGIESEMERLL